MVNSILHPVPLRRNSNKIHLNLNCQPDIKLLHSNWLLGTLLLFFWPKKLLLGIGIGVGYKLSHNGVGQKEVEDLNWSNSIQLRERDRQSVPCIARRDSRLQKVEYGKLRTICQILNCFFVCFLTRPCQVISCDQPGWLNICFF